MRKKELDAIQARLAAIPGGEVRLLWQPAGMWGRALMTPDSTPYS